MCLAALTIYQMPLALPLSLFSLWFIQIYSFTSYQRFLMSGYTASIYHHLMRETPDHELACASAHYWSLINGNVDKYHVEWEVGQILIYRWSFIIFSQVVFAHSYCWAPASETAEIKKTAGSAAAIGQSHESGWECRLAPLCGALS